MSVKDLVLKLGSLALSPEQASSKPCSKQCWSQCCSMFFVCLFVCFFFWGGGKVFTIKLALTTLANSQL